MARKVAMGRGLPSSRTVKSAAVNPLHGLPVPIQHDDIELNQLDTAPKGRLR